MVEEVLAENPCLGCGACCAHYRVSFFWTEANDSELGSVPVDLTEDLTPFIRCMKGTNSSHPRCAALLGTVVQAVACTVYDLRPSPCHQFGLTWSDGIVRFDVADLIRCGYAREACGLEPLAISVRAYEMSDTGLRGA